MTEVTALIYALTGLAALALASIAGLAAFSKWIAFKQAELDSLGRKEAPAPLMSNRIELADLRERLRKLEAIAAGVDL